MLSPLLCLIMLMRRHYRAHIACPTKASRHREPHQVLYKWHGMWGAACGHRVDIHPARGCPRGARRVSRTLHTVARGPPAVMSKRRSADSGASPWRIHAWDACTGPPKCFCRRCCTRARCCLRPRCARYAKLDNSVNILTLFNVHVWFPVVHLVLTTNTPMFLDFNMVLHTLHWLYSDLTMHE